MKIIDAHSHTEYISHLYQNDIVGTIVCAKNESDWDVLLDVAKKDNNIYCAFGIHPWFVNDVQNNFEKKLENLLKTNRNFMIGEIGLDKYKPDMDKQILIFQKQIDLAIRLKRNIFLHCVGAWDKILHVLKQYKKSDLPIIVAHAFNGSDNILNNLLNNYNIMFSFGGEIYKTGGNQRIQQIPNDKILVETDGKKDVVLHDIIKHIAQIKNESDIENIIYNNTQKVVENG